MKTRSFLTTLVVALVLVVAAPAGAAPAASPAARTIVAAMQPGWGMGNTYDAIGADETAWGNPPVTRALLKKVRSQGFKSIRIPVTWEGHQGGAPGYLIDPAWFAKVRQTVDGALGEGLYVMINLHHDSWQWINRYPTERDAVLARYTATWTQLAAAFRNTPDRLVFESINDPMVAATIHFYGFWPFSVNIANFTRFDDASVQDLVGTFDRVHDTFVAHGIPVIMGEYALFGIDPNYPGIVERGEMRKFFEYLGYYARLRKVTTVIWDAGQFLDRRTLEWRDPELFAQIKSSWTTRSGTASTDLVFNSRSSEITSKTLTLNENGTDFQGLRHGSRNLLRGADYTVSGDQLTLTAAALTRLVGDRAYGVNATLEARFSRGVPWRIDIITNGTPVLSNATGTTACPADPWHGCLVVPTDFRGDVLSTMEARYDDGSNAGPANWTPYQQYGAAFWADLPNGAINLTGGFVNSIHFWSGASVTYRVTKSGNAITGTTD
jgi:hypothetical protein